MTDTSVKTELPGDQKNEKNIYVFSYYDFSFKEL